MLDKKDLYIDYDEATLYFLFYLYFLKHFFKCLFIFERERERVSEKQGDTESEAGAKLRAVSTEPKAGLELTSCEIMT